MEKGAGIAARPVTLSQKLSHLYGTAVIDVVQPDCPPLLSVTT